MLNERPARTPGPGGPFRVPGARLRPGAPDQPRSFDPVDRFDGDRYWAAALQPAPGPAAVVPWWRRRFELLVTAGTLGIVVALIFAAFFFRGSSVDFTLPKVDPRRPIGPESAWLDPRYAAGAAHGWQTDDQVLGVAPNREIIVTQVWGENLTPGLAGLDLWTGEQLWRTDEIDCMSQGVSAGRAFCLAEQSGQVVEVNLDDGSIAPVLNEPTAADHVHLVGVADQTRYLLLTGAQSSDLVAVAASGEQLWTSSYQGGGSCVLLVDEIACQDYSREGLQVFDVASGALELQLPVGQGQIWLASDGYFYSDGDQLRGVGFDGAQYENIPPHYGTDLLTPPKGVYFPLAAYTGRDYAVLRDSHGQIRLELVDGGWRLPGASEPVSWVAWPQTMTADGSVLLAFGSDATGNTLSLMTRSAETIDKITDVPAQLYDGIVVADFVVYPPAR